MRAITVAGGVRFIEFAVSGAPFAFEPGMIAEVLAENGGISVTPAFACLPAGPQALRLLVPRGRGEPGTRFMWALVEGARVRLRVATADTERRERPEIRMRGVPVGLRLAHLPRAPFGAQRQAANESRTTPSNISAQRATMRSEPPAPQAPRGIEAPTDRESRAGAAKGSKV